MSKNTGYKPLRVETLTARLGKVAEISKQLGDDTSAWNVKEVGDGNLNRMFVVSGAYGSIIIKQALHYVWLVGDSWRLPLYRAYYEYHALTRQASRAPGSVPQILYFDEAQALIAMEFLEPHVKLRRKLILGERVDALAEFLGEFCAQTAFRGSELSMQSEMKKADVALFAGNVEIPAITEALVFTDPYYLAEMNNHTQGLGAVVEKLRSDVTLKVKVQQMLQRFASNTETLVHGNLHTGSVMSTENQTRVIDPEFVQYGPMGFDIGMLCANFLMAYFSQPAHRDDDLADYQNWILGVIEQTAKTFESEFRHLWATERTGMLYPASLFEDQGDDSTAACDAVLAGIWRDAWAVCGIEMHRRCLSLVHNADFEEIEDVAIRAPLEARNLMLGAELILSAEGLKSVNDVCELARAYNSKDFL